VRRIDPVSFVAAQLGAREVPNLGGIDDADDMTSLVQCTRDAETSRAVSRQPFLWRIVITLTSIFRHSALLYQMETGTPYVLWTVRRWRS
jgi:hypothetical protein